MVKRVNKKIDLLVVSLFLIIIFLIWWFFDLKPLVGGLLYTLIPTTYMFLRKKKNYKKLFFATLLFGFAIGFLYDSILVLNNAWIVDTIIQWKILGLEPLDNFIGYGIMALLMITFYEHFIDDEKTKKLSKNFNKGMIIFSIVLIIFTIIFTIKSSIFELPYPYLIMSSIAIIFPIAYIIKNPKTIPKFFKIMAYFFFVWFLAEIAALKTSGWSFPGQYIGMINIFGVTFPFEELFFWMLWYAITIIAYYEFFIDDKK